MTLAHAHLVGGTGNRSPLDLSSPSGLIAWAAPLPNALHFLSLSRARARGRVTHHPLAVIRSLVAAQP